MASSPSNERNAERSGAHEQRTADGPSRPYVSSAPTRRRAPWQLIAIVVISAAPIVLGTMTFWVWRSPAQTNYGELLAPRQIDVAGIASSGAKTSLAQSQGKWRYVLFDSAACEENCRRKLLYTRQIRIAAGRDQDRVERVWVVEDGQVPANELEGLIADAHLVRLGRPNDADHVAPAAERREFIYLVDPYGNLMMRYPSDPDPRRMIKDLQRLLKYTKTT